MNWDKLWRCNGCRNINLDRDSACSACGRGYKEAGYTTPSTNAATAEISSMQINHPVPSAAINRLFNAVEQISPVVKIIYLRVNYDNLLLAISSL